MQNSETLELVYNLLGNTVGKLAEQNKISNSEMEMILIKVLDDVKSARLIENANEILQLKNRIAELERKEKENDKPNDQS